MTIHITRVAIMPVYISLIALATVHITCVAIMPVYISPIALMTVHITCVANMPVYISLIQRRRKDFLIGGGHSLKLHRE